MFRKEKIFDLALSRQNQNKPREGRRGISYAPPTKTMIYNDKQRLFHDYVKELDTFRKMPDMRSDAQISECCDAYMSSKNCTWKNIFDPDTKELVGFVIFGKSGEEKHPDALRSVEEAYLAPASRKKGLVYECLRDYESRHHGVYSLLVIKGNLPAKEYWAKTFKKLGYTPVELEPLQFTDDETELFGYKPKKAKH